MTSVKWAAPSPGACKETRVDGVRYIIINDRIDEYYLARYPDDDTETRKFKTWAALYKFITGNDPTTKDGTKTDDETYIYSNLIRSVTYETTAASYRKFFINNDEWVLDIWDKRAWRLIVPERVSRTFYRERDAIEWATNYLENTNRQISIADLLD